MPFEKFKINRLRSQSYWYGKRIEIKVMFKVDRLIRIGGEKGMLDERRYVLITREEE